MNSDVEALLARKDLSGVDFDSRDVSGICFADKSLVGACFDDAIAVKTDFQGCDLYWARFFRANVQGADFRKARLNGARLDFADFTNADLRGADFGPDNLDGLTSVVETNFKGAKYDRHTILPDGLKPKSQGMIYSE
jgi:uncharacterized protein YjbI with pentapeptide repeats